MALSAGRRYKIANIGLARNIDIPATTLGVPPAAMRDTAQFPGASSQLIRRRLRCSAWLGCEDWGSPGESEIQR